MWTVGGRAGWARGMVVTPLEAIGPLREIAPARSTCARWWPRPAPPRGLLVGAVIGVAAAMVAAASRPPVGSSRRLAALSNATPWVVVGPILLIVLGRNRGPVGLAAIAALFSVFVSTYHRAGEHPARRARRRCAPTARRAAVELRAVRIPAAVPATIDGLRLAGPAALAGAIFGEWYGAPRGIGVLLVSAMQNGRADRLWAASLLAVALAGALYGVLGLLAGRVDRRFGTAATATAMPRRPFSARRLVVDAAGSFVFTIVLVAIWWGWIEVRHVSPLVMPRPSRVANDIVEHAGSYAVSAAHTLATAGIALGDRLRRRRARRGAVRHVAGHFRPVDAGGRRTGGHATRRGVPAARPGLRLRPGDGARPRRGDGVLPGVRAHAQRAALHATGRGDVVDSFGAGRWNAFARVVFPAAVPRMATGLRLAVASSVVAAVVGESLIGRQGLGVDFTYAYNLNHPASAFGAAVIIVVVSLVVFALATAGEAFVHARWN